MRVKNFAWPFETFSKKTGLGAWYFLTLICLNFPSLPVAGQSNNFVYTWTTLAGYPFISTADGVGSNARFKSPQGVAVDGEGNAYIADQQNNTIRMVTLSGVVTTIAGLPGYAGKSDGIGNNALFKNPVGVAVDSAGNVYVTDNGNATIRMLTPEAGTTNWSVTTIAGLAGRIGSVDGTNTHARFYSPYGIAVDGASNLYVADYQENTIRKITPSGTNWVVSTIAGLAGSSDSTAGHTDGTNSAARFFQPEYVAVDINTNLYVADSNNHTIRKITPSGTNWVTSTLAGLAGSAGSADGMGTNAQFDFPCGIGLDAAGNVYVADDGNELIRKISPQGAVNTLAGFPGHYGSADGTGTNALFYDPAGLAVDGSGNMLVADSANDEIRKVTLAGVTSTLAGLPLGESAGSTDGIGSDARFNSPYGTAVDANGNVYVADTYNSTIRQITSAGLVTTIAGLAGSSGTNDGVGSYARFNQPYGVAVDSSGNVFVADYGNYTVREITAAGVVSTIAGLAGVSGTNDGAGSTARFYGPQGIAVDANDNVYVADTYNNTIREISAAGVVSTIAGLGGNSGTNDGVGGSARFYFPDAIAVDSTTNLYVSDSGNNTIRKLTPRYHPLLSSFTWTVTTIAGESGSSGSNDGVGTNAMFSDPAGIAVDSADNLYVADNNNSTIRIITPSGTNWVVSTIGGLPGFPGSSDGTGSGAQFNYPSGMAIDSLGNLYVADTANNTIREGSFTAFAPANPTDGNFGGNGALRVTLTPASAGGQWRFGWELNWRASGTTVSNLVPGNYPIQFSSVPGWLVVQTTTNFTEAVTNGGMTRLVNNYYPTIPTLDTNSSGTLTVNLATSPAKPVRGSGWQFLGDTKYYSSGFTTNVLAGTYQIGFAPVNGYSTPPNQAVTISAGQATVLTESYLLAAPSPSGVNFPFPVPTNEISDLMDYPFGFNGQLQTDVGYGSGVAVSAQVVLTAAHLIFNDLTLSYVGQAYWYFQQETNLLAVQMPQVAQGWLLLGGYASQRTNDLEGLGGQTYGPDQSSPQSRNLDVAALYFASAVAGGGYGGYLPSDASPNPWLTGNSLKMVAGYPVDGSQFGNAGIMPGVMYQTTPQPYAFNADSQPEVYTAPWVLSYPGNSGGPVYVQLNGYYYPAGVYLGTINNGSYESAVRAIDSAVVNLITNAETLAESGTNFSGGGVITIIPSQAVSASNPGYLEFQLGPPAAVAAGAGWQLQGDSGFSSATNYIRAVLSTNAFTVVFKQIPGWNVPTNQSVSVTPGSIALYSALYTVAAPLQIVSPQVSAGNFQLSFQSVSGQSYTLNYNNNLSTTNWLPYTNVTGNGAIIQLSVPVTNSSQRFFRISQP